MTVDTAPPPVTLDPQVLTDAVELIGTQHERERAAFNRGYNLGRADACVAIAEMEERRERGEQWREWSGRIKDAKTDPQFMAEARKKLKAKPWMLTPLEWSALNNIRLAPLADRETR